MGVIDTFINRFKNRNSKFKEYEEDDRIRTQLGERKLSHNERVLNKLLEEKRQKQIANQLRFMEGQRKREELQKARNFMKFNPNLWNDSSILKQKKIFKNHGGGF